jgi:hypothetical protein
MSKATLSQERDISIPKKSNEKEVTTNTQTNDLSGSKTVLEKSRHSKTKKKTAKRAINKKINNLIFICL